MNLRRLIGDLVRMTPLSEPYYRYLHTQKRKKLEAFKKNPITMVQLVKRLTALNLRAGDTIMVHSGLSSLGYVDGGADTVIDALTKVLGPEGTLLMPTYPIADWSIANLRNLPTLEADAPSFMGVITNRLLGRDGVVRSRHPTHSWAGIGPGAGHLLDEHFLSVTPCGPKSPFEYMLEIDGLILILGSPWGSCTFWHIIEDRVDFPLEVYHPEIFYRPVRFPNNEIKQVPFKVHSPALGPSRIDTRPEHANMILGCFRDFKIVQEESIGWGRIFAVRARSFFRGLELLLKKGITIYKGKP